jgi:general stress protein YciG
MNDVPKRGFAAFSSERLREVSRMGGKAIPREKRFFSRNRQVAAEAGRRGGVRRREASEKDLALLLSSLEGPVEFPLEASGRMMIKINRLLRLNYWERLMPPNNRTMRFGVTAAGREYLERVRRSRAE